MNAGIAAYNAVAANSVSETVGKSSVERRRWICPTAESMNPAPTEIITTSVTAFHSHVMNALNPILLSDLFDAPADVY